MEPTDDFAAFASELSLAGLLPAAPLAAPCAPATFAQVLAFLTEHPHEAFERVLPFLSAHASLQTSYRRAVEWHARLAAARRVPRTKFRSETPRGPTAFRKHLEAYADELRVHLCRVTDATAARVWLRLRRTAAESARGSPPLLYATDSPTERVRAGDASLVGQVAASARAGSLAGELDSGWLLALPVFAVRDRAPAGGSSDAVAPVVADAESAAASDDERAEPERRYVLQGVVELKARAPLSPELAAMAALLCASAPLFLPPQSQPQPMPSAESARQTADARDDERRAPAGESELSTSGSRAKLNFMRVAGEAMRQAAREDSIRLAQVERAHVSLHQSLRDLSVIAKYLLCETEIEPLISKIVLAAKDLLGVEGCSVFLLDDATDELYSLAFETDGVTGAGKARGALRFPRTKGIIGHVATCGTTDVVVDAYADSRFNRALDDATGFRTRNLLTAPVRNASQLLVGVIQLVNKKGALTAVFGDEDVVLVETFAAYCGIAIHNAKTMGDLRKEQSRARLAIEILAVHVMPSDELVDDMLASPVPALGEGAFAQLDDIFLAPDTISDADSIRAIVRMLTELDVVHTLRASPRSLMLFLLAVRKSYRPVIYHNWLHAFSVVHAMFCSLRLGNWRDVLTPIEVAGMMLAAIGHDVDHRGENNAFQKTQHSDLDLLYDSSSPLEQHHLAHLVLLMERTGLLAHLTDAETSALYATIRTVILATDLARHFPNLKQLNAMLARADEAGTPLDLSLPDVRAAVLSALIVMCDLNTAIKPWSVHEAGARKIYEEFFQQGDRERSFGVQPIEMMDKTRCRIPQQQVGFYDFIVRPLYAALVRISPAYRPVLESAEHNRAQWAALVAASDDASLNASVTHLPSH